MDETIIEIPEADPEEGWQPPVLTQEHSEVPRSAQRVSDVFFIQYVICLLVITAFFTVRCFAPELAQNALDGFFSHTHTPTEAFAESLLARLQSAWS